MNVKSPGENVSRHYSVAMIDLKNRFHSKSDFLCSEIDKSLTSQNLDDGRTFNNNVNIEGFSLVNHFDCRERDHFPSVSDTYYSFQHRYL